MTNSPKQTNKKFKDLAESGVATVLSVDQWQATPGSKCDCPKDDKLSVNFLCMHPDGGNGGGENANQATQTKSPDLTQAARYQEIFLDKVGMLYAVQDAASRHVLDDRFDSFLCEGEKCFKDSLLAFLNNQGQNVRETHAFSYLEEILQAKMGYGDFIGSANRKAAKHFSSLWKQEQGTNKGGGVNLDDVNLSQEDRDHRLRIALQQEENWAAFEARVPKTPPRPQQQQSPSTAETSTPQSTAISNNPNPGHVFVCNSSVCDIQCDAFLCPGQVSLKKNTILGSIFGQWYKGSRAAELLRQAQNNDAEITSPTRMQRRADIHLKLQPHPLYDRVVTIQDWPHDDRAKNLPLLIAGEVSLEAQLHAYNLHCADGGGSDNNDNKKKKKTKTTTDLPPDDFRIDFLLETVQQFLELASTLVVRKKNGKPNVHRERYLLALPILGTGGGYAGDMTGHIVHALLEMVNCFVHSKTNMDVVVVTADDATYAHAQVIRNQELERSCQSYPCFEALNESQTEYAAQLASLAAGRHLALFVGAGVSIGSGLPSWFGILNFVEDAFTPTGAAEERTVGDDCDWDPLAMAETLNRWCQTKADRHGLTVSLKKRVCRHLRENGHTLGLLLCLLMSLPFHSMVTQNYDTLIEQACQKWNVALRYPPNGKNKRNLSVIPYRPQRRAHYWLLKMHGCVSRAEDIILTKDDYAEYSTSSKAQALDGLVQASLLTKHFLFVGFSLTDPNYLRIIDQVRDALYSDFPSDN